MIKIKLVKALFLLWGVILFGKFNLNSIIYSESLRRVKSIPDPATIQVGASFYIAKAVLKSVVLVKSLPIPEERFDELATGISLDVENIRKIIEGRYKEKIPQQFIFQLIHQVLEQMQLGISSKDIHVEESILIAEEVAESIYDIDTENILLLPGRNYAFLIKVEEIPVVEAIPKTLEEKIAYYKRHGIDVKGKLSIRYYYLEVADPRVVVHRIEDLQKFFDERSTKYINVKEHPELAFHSTHIVINRAKAIDKLVEEKGLKVSYRYGPGIEKTDPLILDSAAETVENNLALLNEYNIDQVKNSDLLYKISTFKLRTNLKFLKGIGIDVANQPTLLKRPILSLENSYVLMRILGIAEITPANLRISTEDLMEKIKDGKLKTEFNSEQITTLTYNMLKMYPGQEDFFNWWVGSQEDGMLEEYEKDQRQKVETMRGESTNIFERYDLKELNPPSWSLFSLMSYVNVRSRLAQAIIDFAQFCLNKGKGISLEEVNTLVIELTQKYDLDGVERFRLYMVIAPEIDYQKKK